MAFFLAIITRHFSLLASEAKFVWFVIVKLFHASPTVLVWDWVLPAGCRYCTLTQGLSFFKLFSLLLRLITKLFLLFVRLVLFVGANFSDINKFIFLIVAFSVIVSNHEPSFNTIR